MPVDVVVPTEHVVQAVLLVEVAKDPVAHTAQFVLLAAPLNVPARQAVHPDVLAVLAALPSYPAAQKLQSLVAVDPVPDVE